MSAPDAARPAESVEDVLAAHRVVQTANNAERTPVACMCGPGWSLDRHRTWEAHVAAALAEAGIGSLAQARAEAWGEGYRAGVCDEATSQDWTDGKVPPARRNPYAARAAAQQAATRGQGEGVGR